ncbi:hypothetical protein C1H46_040866 [Malus baccata]|uniref:Serpin domain-containing protein n=1 Tax=Malus baccata TaxID=106549 RepID=A0A540KH79_MALBA|nr:hypothetical protein C1H46_040866 [Malus baccata]
MQMMGSALVDKVCSKPDFLDRHYPYSKVEVGDFTIPRFKFSIYFEASKVLKDLGLVLPFTSNVTEMLYSTPAEDAYISGILHEFFIKVNEDGTEVLRQMPQHLKLSWFLHEAAAISAVVLLGSSLSTGPPPQKMDFVADHPFIFLIREENTKMVHHVGHVLNPLAG